MNQSTLPDEVCLTSFTVEGEIIGVDLVSLEDLQEGGVSIPKGVYATAFLTPLTRH